MSTVNITLGRLPGQRFDESARVARRKLLECPAHVSGELSKLDTADIHHQDPALAAATYAAASLVIDNYWELVQHAEPADLKQQKALARSEEYHASCERFMQCYLGFLTEMQHVYISLARTRARNNKSIHEDELLLYFMSASKKRQPSQEGMHMVSMADLVVFLVRLAQVAPMAFERDVGRQSTMPEIAFMLRHHSIQSLTAGIMSNHRGFVYPFLGMLEGRQMPASIETFGQFVPECFEVVQDKVGYTLRVKPALIASYTQAVEIAAQDNAAKSVEQPRVLGCPALYSKSFPQMFEWTNRAFEGWHKGRH